MRGLILTARALLASALFAGAFLVAGMAGAAIDPQAALSATVGDWRLSEVGGRIACTLTLTRQSGVGGYEIKAPLACRRAFPPLRGVAAWALDDKGGIVLSDAAQRPIIVFPEMAGGPYEAKAPDGRTWRLEPLRAGPPSGARPRMAGGFRLTAVGGATLCDLAFTSNFIGTSGRVSMGACTPAWSDKGWTSWSLRASKLTLSDRTGSAILVLKPAEPGSFVIADPKSDLISLTRHDEARPAMRTAPPTPAPKAATPAGATTSH